MPPKRKFLNLANQNQCSKQVMEKNEALRTKLAKQQEASQLSLSQQRGESKRDATVIQDLKKELAELHLAHKALNRQCQRDAALWEAREEAACALRDEQMQAAADYQVRLELICDESTLQLEALRGEVALLAEEKQFVLQQMQNMKSESRAKVGKQLVKVAGFKALAAKERKKIQSVSQQLEKAKLDKVASRVKWVAVKEGAETPEDYLRWGKRVLAQTKEWRGMSEARALAACRALCEHMDAKASAPVDLSLEEGISLTEQTLRKRAWRAKTAIQNAGAGEWKSLLTDILEGEPATSIAGLMPAKLGEIVTEAKRVFWNKLGDFWSAERLLDMKISCKLSRRNYTHARNCFFKQLNKQTGEWGPLWIDDVLIVPPPGEKALRSVSKAIALEYGLKTLRDGKMTMIDLDTLTVKDLMHALETKQLKVLHDPTTGWMVTDLQGNKVCLQIVFDKANIHKLMSQTAVGVAYPNSSQHPCSPEHTHEFAIGESGDDWSGLRDNVSQALDSFNALSKRGFVEGAGSDQGSIDLKQDRKGSEEMCK